MNTPSDHEAILTANQTFYRAFSNKDLREMNLIWWQGTTSLCIHPGGRMLEGWDTIRDSWQSIFNNTDSFEIEFELVKVEIDSCIAYVVGREIVLQSSRGRKVKALSLATNIFQKMAQKWYLVQHHGSPIIR
ncbi:hypothetical protein NIES4102_04270 [Chondrocystis sp. NIES-4102]|nr:hypothetical protein NIES4102_04270 [Chondrocystis sp. NIES-4102]